MVRREDGLPLLEERAVHALELCVGLGIAAKHHLEGREQLAEEVLCRSDPGDLARQNALERGPVERRHVEDAKALSHGAPSQLVGNAQRLLVASREIRLECGGVEPIELLLQVDRGPHAGAPR
jgi:hypothetical protein